MKKGKKTKLIISILLCTVLAFVIFRLFTNSSDKAENPQEGDLSRYQWIEMLCTQTGMTGYSSQTPYFRDVTEEDTYYSYIQSAVEWNVIEKTSRFRGEEYVTGRFIALTAMRAIGEEKIKNCLNIKGELTDKKYLDFAVEYHLVQQDELNQGFSRERAQEVLKCLNDLYFNTFWQDDFEHVEYTQDVIELSSTDILDSNEDITKIHVANEVSERAAEGKILVFEYDKSGFKTARRITGVGADGVLYLDDNIKLDEILNSLVISDIAEISVNDILNYYGIRETDALATKGNTEYSVIPVGTFSSDVQSKGFKISLETEEKENKKKLKIVITNNDSGLSYTLPLEKEIEKDSEYQAELNVDKIFVGTQLEYNASEGVKSAEVVLDSHTTFEGGALSSASAEKKILLYETPIPLGSGIVGVKIQLYLVISAEGTLTLKAEIPMNLCVRYEAGKGIRNMAPDISVDNPEIKADANASLMLRVEPMLVLFTVVNVLDAEVDIGASASAQLTTRQNIMDCADISVAFPVLKCSVGGDDDADTIVGKLGLSGEWEIISAENAKFQKKWHYEAYANGTAQFVEECTYQEQNKEAGNGEQGTAELKNTYITEYGDVKFAFDYPADWRISKAESNEGFKEEVVLENDRGSVITYWEYNYFPLGGQGHSQMQCAEVEKAADVLLDNFIVGKIQATETIDMVTGEEHIVEKDGKGSYAILAPDDIGTHNSMVGLAGWQEEFSFVYGSSHYRMEGTLSEWTEKEEQEVIDILSSFRIAGTGNENTEDDDSIYMALQKGDFSEYAGTYRALDIFEDGYGGGEPLSDLYLDNDGIITGGGMWYSPEPYLNTVPTEVTKNEDGSYKCQVSYVDDLHQSYFLIYPEGTIGENTYGYDESFLLCTPYIQYTKFDGGVSDIIYYRTETNKTP